jgi:hypothetical protein
LEKGNSSDETECDSYDLQVLSSLHQANFKDLSERISAQTVTIPITEETQGSQRSSVETSVKPAHCGFVNISDSEGNIRLVPKKTICWFLENGINKMSNDRVLRIRQLASFTDTRKLIVNQVELKNVVRIGDLCLFKTLPDSKLVFRFLLVRVIHFKDSSLSDRTNRNRCIYEWKLGLLTWASTVLGTTLKAKQKNRRQEIFI